ncbi:MAG: hypothetical protein A2293_08670 [Elusimicrobia bacterium RIFOXYB2_FULL_49_7]|nr:MAG: hypothetical protein A2293_08670 [Elusimicrobia bacterium RIFOXYB2_FULL_49_7]
MPCKCFLFFFCCLLFLSLSISAGPNKNNPKKHKSRTPQKSLKKVHLSLDYVYTPITHNSPDTLARLQKEPDDPWQSTPNFLLSVSAYLHGNIGLGLFYSRYISHVSLDAYAVSIVQKNFRGPYTEKLSVNYFGPVIGIKSSVWDKYLVFHADIRPGLVLFFDDISYSNVINNFSSPVFGLGGSLGMEYKLKNNYGISLDINGLYATIRSMKDGEGHIRIMERDISRADINLGFRYHISR